MIVTFTSLTNAKTHSTVESNVIVSVIAYHQNNIIICAIQVYFDLNISA